MFHRYGLKTLKNKINGANLKKALGQVKYMRGREIFRMQKMDEALPGPVQTDLEFELPEIVVP
jgi:hypothetical protein